jgi:hypothetical protein
VAAEKVVLFAELSHDDAHPQHYQSCEEHLQLVFDLLMLSFIISYQAPPCYAPSLGKNEDFSDEDGEEELVI